MVRYEKTFHYLSIPDLDPDFSIYFYTRVVARIKLEKRHRFRVPVMTIHPSIGHQHRKNKTASVPPFLAHEHDGIKKIPFSSTTKLNVGDEIDLLDKKATIVEEVGGSSGRRFKYFVVIRKESCQGSLLSQGTS